MAGRRSSSDTKGVLVVLAKLAAQPTKAAAPDAWGLGRLPPGNAEAQTKGIVAFRMPLTRVETKIKLSQNRDLEDRTARHRQARSERQPGLRRRRPSG